MQQGRESALVTIADDLEADITDKKRVVIGNKYALRNRKVSFVFLQNQIEYYPNLINLFFLYIVLARTHPCDTASSFVIQGMMEFIGSDHGIGKKKVLLYALLELVSADVNNFLLIFFLLYS